MKELLHENSMKTVDIQKEIGYNRVEDGTEQVEFTSTVFHLLEFVDVRRLRRVLWYKLKHEEEMTDKELYDKQLEDVQTKLKETVETGLRACLELRDEGERCPLKYLDVIKNLLATSTYPEIENNPEYFIGMAVGLLTYQDFCGSLVLKALQLTTGASPELLATHAIDHFAKALFHKAAVLREMRENHVALEG